MTLAIFCFILLGGYGWTFIPTVAALLLRERESYYMLEMTMLEKGDGDKWKKNTSVIGTVVIHSQFPSFFQVTLDK